MRTYSAKFLIFFALCGCQTNTSTQAPAIFVKGVSDFGNVILGDQFTTTVLLLNESSSAKPCSFSLDASFLVSTISPGNCLIDSVPANTLCSFKMIFAPTVIGSASGSINFNNQMLVLYGAGQKPGTLTIAPSQFQLGKLVAGSGSLLTIFLSNSGSSDILYPTITGSSDVTVQSTTCATVLHPGNQCAVLVDLIPKVTTSNYTSALSLRSGGQSSQVNFSGTVSPGPSSGNISFTLNPAITSLTVSSPSITPLTVSVSTQTITDAFGNLVADGTEVSISVFNLKLLSDTVNFQTSVLPTKNGVVSFQIQAGSTVGSANFSAQTGTSYGSYNILLKN